MDMYVRFISILYAGSTRENTETKVRIGSFNFYMTLIRVFLEKRVNYTSGIYEYSVLRNAVMFGNAPINWVTFGRLGHSR